MVKVLDYAYAGGSMPSNNWDGEEPWAGGPMSEKQILDAERRLIAIERKIQEDHEVLTPIINLYNAGKLIGGLIVIICGAAVGAIAIFTFIQSFFSK